MEQFAAAEKVYESLIQKVGPTSDLVTNLSATYVKSGNFSALVSLVSNKANQPFLKSSFEFLYNTGTSFLDLASRERQG